MHPNWARGVLAYSRVYGLGFWVWEPPKKVNLLVIVGIYKSQKG